MGCGAKKKRRKGGGKRRGIFRIIGDYFTGPLKELFIVLLEG